MQAHSASKFTDHAKSAQQTAHTSPHSLEERPVTETQRPVTGIKPGPHDHDSSTDPLCHCTGINKIYYNFLYSIFYLFLACKTKVVLLFLIVFAQWQLGY